METFVAPTTICSSNVAETVCVEFAELFRKGSCDGGEFSRSECF
jgi:hypothetical protein